MEPRERIAAALRFDAPDKVPLRIFPAAGGLYEHGQKLVDLLCRCGHDFGDLTNLAPPSPPGPDAFDEDGSYREFKTDPWGTRWEYRIFGVWGHPVEWPLGDWAKLNGYRPPAPPRPEGEGFERQRRETLAARQHFFCRGGGGSLFEKMHSLRRFEDVLMDLAQDTPEINRLGDLLLEHSAGCVDYSLKLGVDAIGFGDDFGTETALLISPKTWHSFFRPRYDRLFEPVRAAGKPIFFHCCGSIAPILPALRELGVSVIWPQLTAFDLRELAATCWDLGLVVELHPDRGELMQRGTPDQVRRYVHDLLAIFRTHEGGSWLYIEIDPGFPWPNVEALIETAIELRQ